MTATTVALTVARTDHDAWTFGEAAELLDVLLYDLELKPIGRLRVAKHFAVEGAVITRIRDVHDTAAFVPPDSHPTTSRGEGT